MNIYNNITKMHVKVVFLTLMVTVSIVVVFIYYSGTEVFRRNLGFEQSTNRLIYDSYLLERKLRMMEEEFTTNFTTIINDNRIIKVKTKQYKDDRNLIILISTLGRSGSSWIGELLAATDKSMFIYEPIMVVQKIFEAKVSNAWSAEIVSDVMTCQMQEDMMDLKRNWTRVFSQFQKQCGRKCTRTINAINASCRRAENIVIKSIRLRLSTVEDLLMRRSLQHLKVVYITRDPRAQILSRIKNFKELEGEIVPKDCQLVNSGVLGFHRMARMFPGHLYLLRFEDICKNPIDEATQLYKFLKTDHNAVLPATWRKFLTQHGRQVPVNKRKTPYSLFQRTSNEWFQWRTEITNKSFSVQAVEDECGPAMQALGYLPLKTVKNAEDLSVPFLGDVDCDYMHCWSYKY